MKKLFTLFLTIVVTSCISLKKAPEVFTHRIDVAKKFKRQFPKELAFIFEDPKDANEFYNYINTKYQLDKIDDIEVGLNVPFTIDNKIYYLTYHEAEISDTKVNLFGLAVDATLAVNKIDPLFRDDYFRGDEHWFIALTVYDKNDNNCLKSNHPEQKLILDYLKLLQNEYLNNPAY